MTTTPQIPAQSPAKGIDIDSSILRTPQLVKDLRFHGRFSSETEEQARGRRFKERKEAADLIEALSAEVERLRAELAAGAGRQGGGTSDNCPIDTAYGPASCFDCVQRSGAAPAAGTEKDAERLLTAIVRSEIGIATRHKLEDGQGVKTDDGKAWLAAIEFVAAITAHTKAGESVLDIESIKVQVLPVEWAPGHPFIPNRMIEVQENYDRAQLDAWGQHDKK